MQMPHLKLRPKALNNLKEDRLSAKQELKAVANVLSHIGLSLDQLWPSSPCCPADPHTEERRLHAVGDEIKGFVVNRETGNSRWDTHVPDDSLRLIFCPDQGGPLFSAYQFLAYHNAKVGFVRDEL